MILVDTSIWIDHLRVGNGELVARLEHGEVLGHPWVRGELALGRLSHRQEVLELLADLPQATVATTDEVMALIDARELPGSGIGFVDVHLLAATLLTAGTTLWTRDARLRAVAMKLGVHATT